MLRKSLPDSVAHFENLDPLLKQALQPWFEGLMKRGISEWQESIAKDIPIVGSLKYFSDSIERRINAVAQFERTLEKLILGRSLGLKRDVLVGSLESTRSLMTEVSQLKAPSQLDAAGRSEWDQVIQTLSNPLKEKLKSLEVALEKYDLENLPPVGEGLESALAGFIKSYKNVEKLTSPWSKANSARIAYDSALAQINPDFSQTLKAIIRATAYSRLGLQMEAWHESKQAFLSLTVLDPESVRFELSLHILESGVQAPGLKKQAFEWIEKSTTERWSIREPVVLKLFGFAKSLEYRFSEATTGNLCRSLSRKAAEVQPECTSRTLAGVR